MGAGSSSALSCDCGYTLPACGGKTFSDWQIRAASLFPPRTALLTAVSDTSLQFSHYLVESVLLTGDKLWLKPPSSPLPPTA